MSKAKPTMLKAVSPATIMTTPAVITRMMPPSFQEGFSNRKMMANKRTNPNTEDLHIANMPVRFGVHDHSRDFGNVLKKVKVMNLRLVLPSPMSNPVNVAHGAMRVR